MLRGDKFEVRSRVEGDEQKQVCVNFKGHLFAFIRDLDALLRERKLGKSCEFLDKMAQCVMEIDALTEHAHMCGEDMETAALLIQNILTQPLDIPGLPKEGHLVSAAKEYLANRASSAQFSRVMVACVHYAKDTEKLLNSLKIIAYDM